MNVMKNAHAQAKAAKVERPNMSYRLLFRLALIQSHKEYKQMEAEKKAAHKAWAIEHFEDCIAKTVVHYDALGVNDYYVAIEHSKARNDYTLLTHKVEGDTSSPLGWSNYADAIKTHSRQADQYVLAYPGTVKLHAQTYLSKVLESLYENLEQIKAN